MSYKTLFFAPHDHVCGEGCSHCHEEDLVLDQPEMEEEDLIVELQDPETNETFTFYLSDDFEHEGQSYAVLLTTDQEQPYYVIARVVEGEDGNTYMETLDPDDEERMHAVYDEILEAYFEEEGAEEP